MKTAKRTIKISREVMEKGNVIFNHLPEQNGEALLVLSLVMAVVLRKLPDEVFVQRLEGVANDIAGIRDNLNDHERKEKMQ